MDITHTTPDPLIGRYQTPADITAYVPTPSALSQPEERLETTLNSLGSKLADIDADSSLAQTVAEAVARVGHEHAQGVVVVAGGAATEVWPTAHEIDQIQVSSGPLPDLSQLIAWRQAWVPHVLAVVDRAGADITITTAAHAEDTDVEVEGNRLHITKSNPGGWSQKRFQQSAEEQWEKNADLVAEELRKRAEGDIDVLILTGDLRAVELVRDAVGTETFGTVEVLDAGSRAEDGSEDAIDEAVDTAVRRIAMKRRTDLQSRVLDAVGMGSGATGRTDVLTALFAGQVETLLLHIADASGIDAYYGPEPIQVAADSSKLHELDLDAQRAPLVDVALRGAAATGASVLLVEEALANVTDGIAASLRS